MWELIVSVPDHCLSFTLDIRSYHILTVVWCLCHKALMLVIPFKILISSKFNEKHKSNFGQPLYKYLYSCCPI